MGDDLRLEEDNPQSRILNDWSARLTRVWSGRSYYYPNAPNSIIPHPALDYAMIPWGSEGKGFLNVWDLFYFLRENVSKVRKESVLARSRLSALDWKLTSPSDKPEDKELTDKTRSYLEHLDLANIINQLFDALDWGFVAPGFEWGAEYPEIDFIPQWAFQYVLNSKGKTELRLNDGGDWDKQRKLEPDGLGSHIPERAVLPLIAYPRKDRPYGQGIVTSIYHELFFRDYVEYRQKWYMESYDAPILIVRCNRKNARQVAEAKKIVKSLEGFVRAVAYSEIDEKGELVEGIKIELHQVERTSDEVYTPVIRRLDEVIHEGYSGGILDAMAPDKQAPGSFALAKEHAKTTDDVTIQQARIIQGWFNRYLRWLYDYKYGAASPLPSFEFITAEDLAAGQERMTTLLLYEGSDPGDGSRKVSPEQFQDEFKIEPPLPQDQGGLPPVTPPGLLIPGKAPAQVAAEALRLESPKVVLSSSDQRMEAAQVYAKREGVNAARPVEIALRAILARYQDPKPAKGGDPSAPDPRNVDKVLKPMEELLAQIPQIGEGISIGSAAKGLDLGGITVPLDILPLADRIQDVATAGYLSGWANSSDQLYAKLASIAKSLELPKTLSAARVISLASAPGYGSAVTDITSASDAWRLFMMRAKHPVPSDVWRELEDALKARTIGYSRLADIHAVERVTEELRRSLNLGLSQQQFAERMSNYMTSQGLDAASPWYLETVFRTVIQQEYGKAQSGLVDQIDGGRPQGAKALIWGYQWFTNLGKEPHHYGHLEMNLFAAPVEHIAWSGAKPWIPGCDFNCACGRIIILTIDAEGRSWIGVMEPVKPYPGIEPRLQLAA